MRTEAELIRGTTIFERWIKWFKCGLAAASASIDEQCPHCGYYCTGRSVFCTKHPEGPRKR